mmetsp:Transcript_21537/g.28342  ORF Transcript_21537/g.28342 Transcript_21537/m.28342 type:complete len:81 (+) Transcript_21537:339-581(+)
MNDNNGICFFFIAEPSTSLKETHNFHTSTCNVVKNNPQYPKLHISLSITTKNPTFLLISEIITKKTSNTKQKQQKPSWRQ